MPDRPPKNRFTNGRVFIVCLLLAIHAVLGIQTIRFLSPTYDEPVHLAAGYSFLKTGDYRMNAFANAPLAQLWAALPQLIIKPLLPVQHPYWEDIGRYSYPFADLFLYQNRVDAEKLLNASRYMILLLSLLLGIAVYRFARELSGEGAALCALFLWCFAPFFLANATLVTTDMALTLSFFAAIYFFRRFWAMRGDTGKIPVLNALLAGASIGCAMASKHSAIVLFPILAGIMLYDVATGRITLRRPLVKMCAVFCAAYAVLLLAYGFHPLSSYYWLGLKKVMAEVGGGRSTFLMGHYSTRGWRYYFPAVFILKTPLPLLLLLAAALSFKRMWSRDRVLFLLWPSAVYFAAGCLSSVQIGHRHILPVYPFLLVWVSGLYPCVRSRALMIVGALLFIWYGAGTMRIHPWHISYFNEIVGSPDNGYRYLTDSNVDWGQGLKELARYLREQKVTGIYLCYFGTGDPHYYGIAYRPIGFVDNMNCGLRDGDPVDFGCQPRVLFVISATNAQATYYADKNIFAWLKRLRPERIIAHSLLVYDIGSNPEQYRKFREIFTPKGK